MQISVIGIDIGKYTFHAIGLDQSGKIVLKKCFTRSQLLQYTGNLEDCLIGMEACCGAHHLGRTLAAQGHRVQLMPPKYVRPYVKSNKNDYLDAEAIAEAVQRPRMRFVPLKTDEQLDLQSQHRLRDRLVAVRTALINQIRGFLLERGIVFRRGAGELEAKLPELLEDAELSLTSRLRQWLCIMKDEWTRLKDQTDSIDKEIKKIAKESTPCQRLMTVPGIGPITATALVSAIGNGSAFRKGRDLAVWVGLVPRQFLYWWQNQAARDWQMG